MKTIELKALDGKVYTFQYEPPAPVTIPDILESLGDALA